jgi:hypothetical protein
MSDQCKECIIVPIHKNGDKTHCSNYRCVSLLSISYELLFSVFSRVIPYIDETVGDHQCEF